MYLKAKFSNLITNVSKSKVLFAQNVEWQLGQYEEAANSAQAPPSTD